MGLIVSTLRNCCLGREKNENCVESHLNSTDIKTAKQKNENCVEDTESKKQTLIIHVYSMMSYQPQFAITSYDTNSRQRMTPPLAIAS